MKKLRKSESPFWRHCADFFTLALWAAILRDFLTGNGEQILVTFGAALAVGALGVYASEKEHERWAGYHREHHPGELYPLLWTILIGLLFEAQQLSPLSYRVPPAVIAAYIAVLVIFAITHKSKEKYARRKARKPRRA